MIEKIKVGSKIYLRRITPGDTKLVVQWRNSAEVRNNFIYRTPITFESHMKWYEKYVVTAQIEDFIVCDINTDKELGCVYLQKFEKEHRRAESGIFLGSETVKGQGIGSEALELLVKYGFEQKKLHKIVARVLSTNIASIKLHERVGYKQEAYFKDEVFVDGKYHDIVMLGIISNNN